MRALTARLLACVWACGPARRVQERRCWRGPTLDGHRVLPGVAPALETSNAFSSGEAGRDGRTLALQSTCSQHPTALPLRLVPRWLSQEEHLGNRAVSGAGLFFFFFYTTLFFLERTTVRIFLKMRSELSLQGKQLMAFVANDKI